MYILSVPALSGRPQDKKELTFFYLIISLGGFIGSVLVTWLAPLIFILPIEYITGIFIIALALKIKEQKGAIGWPCIRFIIYLIAILLLWPLVFKRYNIFGLIIIFSLFYFIFKGLGRKPAALSLALLGIIFVAIFTQDFWSRDGYRVYTHRNYYGIYKVVHYKGVRFLLNGTTIHGGQFIDKEKEDEPITYYHKASPIYKLFESKLFSFKKVGVVGLGTGTMAAFVEEGQTLDFFELDPDVLEPAELFSYIKKSKAKINFILGDARISLEKSKVKDYDILILDAFSGDSIPVHLLTTEAIKEYRSYLKDKGIILCHISNRYVDIAPVLFSNANDVHAFALINLGEVKGLGYLASTWMILTWDSEVKDTLASKLQWKDRENYKEAKFKSVRSWTDNYSNVLSVLKVRGMLSSIKEFEPFYW